MAGHSHRSSIKNGHKAFKSKHASKGSIKRLYKGKVERDVKSGGSSSTKPLSKLQRKNMAKQSRQQKIMEIAETRRLYEGPRGTPKIITVIPLTADVYFEDIIAKLLGSEMPNKQFEPMKNEEGIRNVYISKFKSNLTIMVPDMSNFLNILDYAKIADFVVFGLSATSEVDQQFGEQIIRALELQGISTPLGVITNLSKAHPKEKFQLDIKQSLQSYFKHFFPNEDRIYNLEKSSEQLNALKFLCQKYPRQVTWRDNRGYLVADNVDYQDTNPNSDHGELIVHGIVRGIGFHANRLLHIPGLGDFQINYMERIKASTRNRKTKNKENAEFGIDLDLDTMFQSNDNRDSLEEYAPVDMAMEEWSDEEDFEYSNLTSARYDDHGFLPGREEPAKSVRLPKGTSEYQAKWYLNDMVDESDDVLENESLDAMDGTMDIIPTEDKEMSDYESSPEEDDFMELSADEEERQLQEYRQMEKEDLEFPDEIELKPTESGIERLRRYRGLKNLHNCIWNYDEKDKHAPPEWKRLLRIGNYKNTKNKILKDASNEAQVIAGDYVKISINFPKFMLAKIKDPRKHLLAIYGLLPHEHKNGLVNFSLQRWEEYDSPVPSKEPLVVQYGVRRYTIQPLFSSAFNSPNNVHKYERFLHANTMSIATCIAPVDFTQSPALFFKPSTTDIKQIELVGHGTFLNVDHTRILAKRAILTGHPFRFHKTVVTVRYMFFNPEDVEWFKSIPLFTKSGRSGFIKERLGTHGYFKATFDGKLSAQDVVAMSLYKRIWPKTSLPWVSNGELTNSN